MKKALLLIMILTLGHRAWGQATNSIFPAQSFTASAQTGATIQLNRAGSSSTIGSNFSVGTITLTGTSITTVTFAVMGSSDNGVTFFALPISTVATPGTTPTSTVTATTAGQYQVNLVGMTHVYLVTSGTFTATSVSLMLTASPNGSISRVSSGSGGNLPDAPAAGYAPVSTAPGTGGYTAQQVPSLSTTSPQQFAGPVTGTCVQGVCLANSYPGADIITRINAAYAACGTTPTCVVGVLPGIYLPPSSGMSPTLTMTSPVTQKLIGLGAPGSVVIQSNVGSGQDAILFKAANFRTYFQQATNTSGGIENITFINTVAGSNTLHTGNVIGSYLLNDVFTNSSTAGGNACVWIDNSLDSEGSPFAGYYERNRWFHVQTGNPNSAGSGGCTYQIYAKQNGGTNSLEYNNLDVMMNLAPGQFGLYMDGSGSTSGSPLELQNGTLNIFANVNSSSTQSATNPEVITVTANSTVNGEFASVSGENNPISGQTTNQTFANGIHVYTGGSYSACGGSENFRVMQDVGGPITTYCTGALPNSVGLYGENAAGSGSISMLNVDSTNAVHFGGGGGSGGSARLFYLTATCAATSGAPDCASTPWEFDAAVWDGTASVLNDWRIAALSSQANNQANFNVLPVNQPSNITDFYFGAPAFRFIRQTTQAQGTCSAAREWELYPVTGTPDLVQLCTQTTSGVYAWASIITSNPGAIQNVPNGFTIGTGSQLTIGGSGGLSQANYSISGATGNGTFKNWVSIPLAGTFAATLTIPVTNRYYRITLTGNVTSSTMAAGVDGQQVCLDIVQGSGPFTFAFPANVHIGSYAIGTVNGKDNVICTTYVAAATAWIGENTGAINE